MRLQIGKVCRLARRRVADADDVVEVTARCDAARCYAVTALDGRCCR